MVDYSCKHYQIKCAKSEDACKEYTEQAKNYADSVNPETFVKTSGDQTIDGNVLLKGSITQRVVQCYTSQAYNVAPTNSSGVGKFVVRDKDGNYMMQVGCERINDGRTVALLRAHSPVDSSKSAQLQVSVKADGSTLTYAPTPPTSDNSTQIATTAWVNSRECTTKATTTSSASKTKPAVVVQNYVNGSNWYRVWSDGWIEQGGLWTTSTGGETKTVTFLKAFTNTNYEFVMSMGAGSDVGSHGYPAYWHSKKATTVSLRNGNNGSTWTHSWYACGY